MDTEQLRAYALALPEAEERETWGHPTFRVRDKMFLTLSGDGSGGTVKATLADQAELVAQDPGTWSVPAYVGRHGWVGFVTARVDAADLEPLVVEAWRATAPERLVRAYDEARSAGA
ncbi:MmcQ/YjbR family DNA-binding protein [Motilibacter aurantiacus]|uniref:MmcQ/YjbR family DNA-binding protein n=1 Tax=Motilibacter aurantiacus TaxID=2714955 RepID=UPI00140BF905|nr:MmcQ/YjbR family DNA-binding protein [Motilibacter aurantiacus]NHC45664.1 MmcQ/YjbR family DNA-binding protein [Motilibacter aurantiacus]